VKYFGEKQAKREQCNFLEYRPKGVINSIKKILGKTYETEEDPICSYLYSKTEYRKRFYLCPHEGNLTECKKVRTLDKKLDEYEDFRKKIESNASMGIVATLDRMSTIFTLEDYEIIISDDYKVRSLLKGLRKKADVSGKICVESYLGKLSFERIIRMLEKPPLTKEKIEYISVLKKIKLGEFDIDKYTIESMKRNVGKSVRFVKFETRRIEHEPYKNNEVTKNER
jgi:hypothetical protein